MWALGALGLLAVGGLAMGFMGGEDPEAGRAATLADTAADPRPRAPRATEPAVERPAEAEAPPAPPAPEAPTAPLPAQNVDPGQQLPALPPATSPLAPGHTIDAPAPREADEATETTGWRLGATRRRIEQADHRLGLLRGQLATLEARGDGDTAARQRRVVDRFEERLEELRADEDALRAEAAADGTLADEDTGYDAVAEGVRAVGGQAETR